MTDERCAVLLIRVWLEGQDGGFRARLTAMGTSAGSEDPVAETTVALGASPRDVVTAVERWLGEFVEGPAAGG